MVGLKGILIFSCILATSLCDPINGNETGVIVQCETVNEEQSRAFIKSKLEDTRNGRVVYGIAAKANQFPYIGYSVLYRPTSTILCGCSLISSTFVLTAAHCLKNVSGGQIFFGSIDSQAMPVSQSIRSYVMHPQFNPATVANDIAVSRLYGAVKFSLNIQVIQLPTRAQAALSFTNVTLTTSGFGLTATGSLPRYLLYTNIKGMAFNDCKSAHWVYTSSMICGKSAFSTGSSVCSGDSGGPLVDSSSGVTRLVGVNSYVQTASCINDIQGFTRVGSYLDWISAQSRVYINW